MGPLVSVVVIFLNEEAFLPQAVDSVLRQTWPRWELLLVDDGSTDGSPGIAHRYADAHPGRVRYLDHPGHANRGMSASRNLGVRWAAGDHVAFLDADDVLASGALEEQVRLLEAHPEAGLVYGPLRWWYGWTGRPEDRARDHVEALGVPADQVVPPPTLLPLFLRNRAAVPSGFLVRRPVLERLGGFEEAFRGEYEDQVFCAKVCASAPVFASGRCWYWYRQHPDSCVARGLRTGATAAARRAFLAWLAGYLRARRVTDPAVWDAVRAELWRARHPGVVRVVRRGRRALGRVGRALAGCWAGRVPVRARDEVSHRG